MTEGKLAAKKWVFFHLCYEVFSAIRGSVCQASVTIANLMIIASHLLGLTLYSRDCCCLCYLSQSLVLRFNLAREWKEFNMNRGRVLNASKFLKNAFWFVMNECRKSELVRSAKKRNVIFTLCLIKKLAYLVPTKR